VWDKLKAKADERRGVGRQSLSNGCLHGLALECDGIAYRDWLNDASATKTAGPNGGPVSEALCALFGGSYEVVWGANDRAHERLRGWGRVPFEAIMAELGIVRGEEVPNA
jgi:hypothetical protein